MSTVFETNGMISASGGLGAINSAATFKWYSAAPCKGVLTLVARNAQGVQIGETKHIPFASLVPGQAIFRATDDTEGVGALDAAHYLDVKTPAPLSLELSVAGKATGYFAASEVGLGGAGAITVSGNGQCIAVSSLIYNSGNPGGGGG